MYQARAVHQVINQIREEGQLTLEFTIICLISCCKMGKNTFDISTKRLKTSNQTICISLATHPNASHT